MTGRLLAGGQGVWYIGPMVRTQIEDLAKKFGITLIYLFGSEAEKGRIFFEGGEITSTPASDLDIAVAFEKVPSEPMDVYGRLYNELSEIFHPFHVDLLFVHDVDTLFRYEVIKGIRIFASGTFDADAFEEDILKKSEDLFYKKKRLDREIMEAVENGYIEIEYKPNP